jgi:hypothetical protein
MNKRNIFLSILVLFIGVLLVGCGGKAPDPVKYTVTLPVALNSEYYISAENAEKTVNAVATYAENANVLIGLYLAEGYDIEQVVLKANGQVVAKQGNAENNIAYYNLGQIKGNIVITIENLVGARYDIEFDVIKDIEENHIGQSLFGNVLLSTSATGTFKNVSQFAQNSAQAEANTETFLYLKLAHIDAYKVEQLIYLYYGDESFDGVLTGETQDITAIMFERVPQEDNLFRTTISINMNRDIKYYLCFDLDNPVWGPIENSFDVEFSVDTDIIEAYAIDNEGNRLETENFKKTISQEFKFVVRPTETFIEELTPEAINNIFKDRVIKVNGQALTKNLLSTGDGLIEYYTISANKVPTSYTDGVMTDKFVITVEGLHLE